MTRVTQSIITKLNKNEIFVFGSNLKGIHGAGAAKTALQWGATLGNGKGLQGQTYAIPTKDENIKTLPLSVIDLYVKTFIYFAQDNPQLTFFVTEIGCGLAGLTPKQIAPMFDFAKYFPNIHLPKKFWDIIGPPSVSLGDKVFITESTRVLLGIEDGVIFVCSGINPLYEEFPIILSSPEYKISAKLDEVIKL